ncbi:MAG: hypothetical protein K2Y27_21850 [Xanthobacteraceae bacterium]|nr:hypothetical protein [Xanthobacteraceae bacterium]
MNRAILVTSSLLASFAMLGTANAGPKMTDKNLFPNEVHAQSGHGAKQQREADWRRARAHANRASDRPSANRKGAPRYQGGPKLPPVYW